MPWKTVSRPSPHARRVWPERNQSHKNFHLDPQPLSSSWNHDELGTVRFDFERPVDPIGCNWADTRLINQYSIPVQCIRPRVYVGIWALWRPQKQKHAAESVPTLTTRRQAAPSTTSGRYWSREQFKGASFKDNGCFSTFGARLLCAGCLSLRETKCFVHAADRKKGYFGNVRVFARKGQFVFQIICLALCECFFEPRSHAKCLKIQQLLACVLSPWN